MEATRSVNLRTHSISQRLQEAEEFFMKQGPVHSTLERLARRLEAEGIPYAVVGGMALYLHGFERMTRHVDVLMTSDGLDEFIKGFVGRGYVPSFSGARKSFRDTDSQVPIEILFTGEYPGDGKPKPVSFPTRQRPRWRWKAFGSSRSKD